MWLCAHGSSKVLTSNPRRRLVKNHFNVSITKLCHICAAHFQRACHKMHRTEYKNRPWRDCSGQGRRLLQQVDHAVGQALLAEDDA